MGNNGGSLHPQSARVFPPAADLQADHAVGFWSYTHADDAADGGRIVRLATRLAAEFGLLTGRELSLFVDRTHLTWGTEWRARIDEALETTTFFIPVVTPRYFQRPECRQELLTFAGHARSLSVEDLLLPVLYADVAGLDAEAEDEAVALVARTQYEDWRELRLLEESSGSYRQAINRLALRLAEVAAARERQPSRPEGHAATATDPDAVTDEPGYLELLAEGEAALPRWVETIESFGKSLDRLAGIGENGAREMEAVDARGGGFAGRLAASRKVAQALGGPAEEISKLAKNYVSDLVMVDPAVLTLIRMFEEGVDAAEAGEFLSFFAGVRELADASRASADGLQVLIQTLDDVSKATRELRDPVGTMRDGLRDVLDAQSIIDEWKRRIDGLATDEDPA